MSKSLSILSIGAVILLAACAVQPPSTSPTGQVTSEVCEDYVRAIQVDGTSTSVKTGTACNTDVAPAFKDFTANGLTVQLPTFSRVDPATGVVTACEGYVARVVSSLDATHKEVDSGLACHPVKKDGGDAAPAGAQSLSF